MNKKILFLIVILLGLAVLVAGCGGKDLSTPSSRIVGHWQGGYVPREKYFGPIDDQTRTGSAVEFTDGDAFYFQYRVVSEEINGVTIKYVGVHPDLSDALQVEMEFWIKKDGLTMTNANNPLDVYEYVDSKTEP